MRRALVILLVSVSACSRCSNGGAPAAFDAGTVEVVRRETDLRSAITLVFPEYRGALTLGGVVRLNRSVRASEKVAEDRLRETLSHHNFTLDTDGGLGGQRDQFHMSRARFDAERTTYEVRIPLPAETIEKLYGNPNSLSSAHLALWMPKSPDVPTEREVFTLDMEYEGVSDNRTAFLTHQLVSLLLGNSQWTAELPPLWNERTEDGGFVPQPEGVTVTLREIGTQATLTMSRWNRRVHLHYELVTAEEIHK